MTKTILITGATDGIGFETAKVLVEQGHHVLLHGRNPEKLQKVETELGKLGLVKSYVADLSDLKAVRSLAKTIAEKHQSLDVLINNAGVLKTPNAITADGIDVRFAVNTIAPYLLTKKLLPILGAGRVVNVSSAAQAPVDLDALIGKDNKLDAMSAYSQSKLAITMWSYAMGNLLGNSPIIVAVNPGSLLGSKMVKEGFGVAGKDIGIGVDILIRASFSDEFANASGKYFDNDSGCFGNQHPDALNKEKCEKIIEVIDTILN
ncbi:SDR family NAD(P)-dependent oxidoreductase [Candidatus Uabimicrobium sp. HlEnr_7]|uniref:SDR family NAD(P)-dependent oxidoreductase n=1 Tax=Candidatus Uabimicrobium helgolandensis TaxID=3095367 RepID=UPI003557F2DD